MQETFEWKRVEISSDSSDMSFDHSKGKNGQNLQVTFLTFMLITFVILPIFSNQVHFQKVDVYHINCTKQFIHKLSLGRRNRKNFEDPK